MIEANPICKNIAKAAQDQTTQNQLAESVVEQVLVKKPAGKVVYSDNEQLDLAAEPGL